jgi:hypothetical protein
MAAFPTLAVGKPDSRQYAESQENTALRTELEGGYTATRPKHTRTPRRYWKVAYQYMNNADKALLDAHWNTQRGGSLAFDWVNPQNGTTYTVRYKSTIEWVYKGAGPTQRWDCSFELEQV